MQNTNRTLLLGVVEADTKVPTRDKFITIHFHNQKQVKILPDTGEDVIIRECIEALGLNGTEEDWYIYTNSRGEHWLTPAHP